MLPFGILAGYWGHKEVRITAISEYGFQTRLAMPATEEQKNAPWNWHFTIRKQLPITGSCSMMQLLQGKRGRF